MKHIHFLKQGFTLVELMVVIGIISILTAMLLPALNKAREMAKTVMCASNMRQIALAAFAYANDNGGRVPYAGDWGTTYHYRGFFSLLAPYLGIPFDPDHPSHTPYMDGNTVFTCPDDTLVRPSWRYTGFEGGDCSYAVNGYVSDVIDTSGGGGSIFGPGNGHPPLKFSQIPESADTLLLVECYPIQPDGLGSMTVTNVWGDSNLDTVKAERPTLIYAYTKQNTPYKSDRAKQGYHHGVNNWAFADGHVAAMNWSQTLAPINLWRVNPADKVAYDPGAAYVR